MSGKVRPSKSGKTRRARWRDDTDPIRAQVLYQLAAQGYEKRHGRHPIPKDLNFEFPASAAGAKTYGAWNKLQVGKSLPRQEATPQGQLMKKLSSIDPNAAKSFSWPIWNLSSSTPLSIFEVHALMLDLAPGIRHQLIGKFRNGRYLRWPTNRLTEINWMVAEKNLDGLTGLIAIMREAELQQDIEVYESAHVGMVISLDVLDRRFGTTELAQKFAKFLISRFGNMAHVMFGAYEKHPLDSPPCAAVVQTQLLTSPRHVATAEFELNWKTESRGEPNHSKSR